MEGKLAADLADRFGEVIPDRFQIESRGLIIEFVPPSGPGAVIDMRGAGDPEQFAVGVMNRVQDVVMEWTTTPWPSSDESKNEARTLIPLPDALIEDQAMRLVFGSREDPDLELLSVPFR